MPKGKPWTGKIPDEVLSRDGACGCGCGGITNRARFNYPAKGMYKGYPARYLPGHTPRPPRLPVPADVAARTGVCECGCGSKTPIASTTATRFNNYKGYPYRFVKGHQTPREAPAYWTDKDGYVMTIRKGHPNAKPDGSIALHRLVMSDALGRPLLPGETVHHIDLDKSHNTLGNLQLRQGQHGTGAAFECGDCGSHNVIAVPLREPATAA